MAKTKVIKIFDFAKGGEQVMTKFPTTYRDPPKSSGLLDNTSKAWPAQWCQINKTTT